MTSMKELIQKYLGKEGYIVSEGMEIKVVVLDVKSSYGRIKFLVAPVAGGGQTWKEQDSVKGLK